MTLSTRFETFRGSITKLPEHHCGICLEDFSSGEPVVHKRTNLHPYHKKCLSTWARKNPACPTCLGEITHINDTNIKYDLLKSDLKTLLVTFVFSASLFALTTLAREYNHPLCSDSIVSTPCLTHAREVAISNLNFFVTVWLVLFSTFQNQFGV